MLNPNTARLTQLTTIIVPAVYLFYPQKKFKASTIVDGVRFAKFGENFKALLSKTSREDEPERMLNVSKLNDRWTNKEIVDNVPSIAFAHIFEVLKLQPLGERTDTENGKPLHILHGMENIFHIQGTDYVVRIEQEGGGWHIGANHKADRSGGGDVGHFVFSPVIGVSRI